MKQFFKFFTASCLGTLTALFLLLIIGVIIGSSSMYNQKKIANSNILTIDLNRIIPEKSNNLQRDAFDLDNTPSLGVQDIKRLLKKAETDEKISTLVVHSSGMSVGIAKANIIYEALKEFKSSGKSIYAYGDYYSQSDYLIACMADSIYLNPTGNIDLRGFRASYMFFKDMLDRIGVEMNVFYAGEFKSGSEPYRRNDMSEENRFQTSVFLKDLYDQFLTSIMDMRPQTTPTLVNDINTFKFQHPEDALDGKIIDVIGYVDQFETMLKQKLNVKDKKKLPYLTIDAYRDKTGMPSKGRAKDKIAVVYAEGAIEYKNKNNGVTSEIKFVPMLEKLRHQKNLKAVVLRVDSPGGSAHSSEQIWRAIERLKEDSIPVVASYGSYAASGGYYISCGADSIISDPNSLTGSIGVYSIFPNMRRLFNNKLGIHFDTVKSAKYAITMSPYFDLREDEKAIFKKNTEEIYELFLKRVSDGRNMTRDEVHEVARGRVWTGRQALEIGLVDKLGGLEEAIETAARMANIDDYKIIEYPKIVESEFTKLIRELTKDQNVSIGTTEMTKLEKEILTNYYNVKNIMADPKPQMRLPIRLDY